MRSLAIALASALLTAATVGCQTQETRPASAPVGPQNADKLLIVDCLLPGQVRKLGSSLTYLTPRRPIKTSAVDCEIRGGEYTAFDRADYRTALNVWLPQAKEGDPQAQNYVGEIYEKGLGTIPDYQAAAYWYRKSAEQGESRAQINLGFLYEKGLGVKKDLAEALNWYRKASGIQEDELEFASSVEASARELARAEVEKARSETRQLREELERTRSQLQRRKGDLNAAEREMQRLREQLESARSGAGAMSSEEVERYRRALERQQSEVAAQRRRIAQLESEVSRKQADLAGSRHDLFSRDRISYTCQIISQAAAGRHRTR